MHTEPFHRLLAAVLSSAFAVMPALADGQPAEMAAPPPIVKPKAAHPQPDKPAPTTIQGLHLKLGNVEVKVRGPVIIDPGSGDASQQGK